MKIKRRGERVWQLVWELGRDPVTGKRRQRYQTIRGSRRDAERAWLEGAAEIHRDADPGRRTVSDLAEEWIRELKATGRTEATIRQYETHLRLRILPAIGKDHISKVDQRRIRQLLHMLPSDLTPRTRDITRIVLRTMFARAVAWGYIDRSPMSGITPIRGEKAEVRVWTADEVRKFLEVARTTRLGSLWVVLVTTGLRISEALGLRWEDVDLEGATISVRHQLDPRTRTLRPPKSARGRRRVAIGRDTVLVLREWKHNQGRERLSLGLPPADFVWLSEAQTPIMYRNILRSFRALIDKAGVPRIRIHDLRHTHATMLLMAGIHPQIVSERLGHATVSFTLDTYSHVLPTMQAKAAEEVERILLTERVGGQNGGRSHRFPGRKNTKAP